MTPLQVNLPPSRNVRGGLAPDVARKRGKVGGWRRRGFNAIGKVNVSRSGGVRPSEGRVKAIESVELSIADRDLTHARIRSEVRKMQ